MNLAAAKLSVRVAARACALAIILVVGITPVAAQNKKNAWEIFLYFGGFLSNDIPSATQSGSVRTYRVEPSIAMDPNDLSQVFRPDLGRVGGDQTSAGPNDPNYSYPFGNTLFTQLVNPPCLGDLSVPGSPNEQVSGREPYADECDNDEEALWRYNAGGMVTNGEIQRDDSEFLLGLRAGYNITRHWEVEIDFGFGKQRLDLTKNLDPLLMLSLNDISDPRAAALAKFYQFTWANRDYEFLYPTAGLTGLGEHPAVIASRIANDPNYNIPLYFPTRPDDPDHIVANGETFEDVTDFINRVFQDPTAFRNRGNQINVDTFTLSGNVNYNFNTKADSRIIPYATAGAGRWIRNFDDPWDGEDTNFLTYGAGIRFFVNEIFAFRADFRAVTFLDDSFRIEAQLNSVNLQDRQLIAPLCMRDQRALEPPCENQGISVPAEHAFPDLGGGGGNATVEVDAELDDYFEFRVGFDVILGGR